MADAHGALSDLAAQIETLQDVARVQVQELHDDHAFQVLVDLSVFNTDTWDQVVQVVDAAAREHVRSASVELDVRVLSSADHG